MSNIAEIKQIIARWDSGGGRPFKGSLIDWQAYEGDPENMGCMCAQGQVLHTVGGWDFAKLRDAQQADADAETARLLNISRAHAVLLRDVNDKQDGAPSIVLTNPAKVLGDKWSKLLDFWWLFHEYNGDDWRKLDAARGAARGAARDAAWEIQGYDILSQQGRKAFFLPMFGIKTMDDIPVRPDDYGFGIVPHE